MKRSKASLRAVHQFPYLIEQRLKMYAIAAGAAAVGLAFPADAKIIYTHANQPITNGLALDLNHDGTGDFAFYRTGSEFCTSFGCSSRSLLLVYDQSNRFWRAGRGLASALPTRVLIGSNAERFASGYGVLAVRNEWCTTQKCQTTARGPWAKVTDRYLGLKFQIKGKTHYGWARLTVDWIKLSATLTGYAYETVADQPILIGNGPLGKADAVAATVTSVVPRAEPGGLGSLALGVAGWKARMFQPLGFRMRHHSRL